MEEYLGYVISGLSDVNFMMAMLIIVLVVLEFLFVKVLQISSFQISLN